MFPFRLAQRSQAGLKRSKIQRGKKKKKNHSLMEVARGKPVSLHLHLHGRAPRAKRAPSREQGKAGQEGKVHTKVCSEALAHGEGGPQLVPAAPTQQAAQFPARSMPLRAPAGDPAGTTRGNPGTCSPRKVPDLSVLGQGRSPSHERVQEQGDTFPGPRLRGDAPGRQAAPLAARKGAWRLPVWPRSAACPWQTGK